MPVQPPAPPPKPSQWKVVLHLAHSRDQIAKTGKSATQIDKFGVAGNDYDAAKRAARAWLVEHGFKVRAINLRADVERELVAYVEKA